MKKQFEIGRILAVDFETASSQRASACSMGLCIIDYRTGEVIEKQHYYINPEVEFCSRNIHVNGITPDMVADAPTFPEIIGELSCRIGKDTIVVSHNAPFDISVILRSCIRYDVPPPDFCYYCTLAFSKKLLPGLSEYTLDSVSERCGLPSFSHHRADDDAEACAHLFYHLIHNANCQTISAIDRATKVKHRSSMDKYNEIIAENCKAKDERHVSHISATMISIPIVKDDPADSDMGATEQISPCDNSSFFGLHVVFTGALQNYTRSEAFKAVLNAGGLVGDNVASYTDILVCGDGYRSSNPTIITNRKYKKAKEYIAIGKKIAIIDEEEFIQMLVDYKVIQVLSGVHE